MRCLFCIAREKGELTMLKPLKEEQAAMKSRWSDPAYQWANDSALRRKILKETDNARNKERKSNRKAEQNTSQSQQRAGSEAATHKKLLRKWE